MKSKKKQKKKRRNNQHAPVMKEQLRAVQNAEQKNRKSIISIPPTQTLT